MTSTDVLVVGAGPTGLTAANLLARSGVDFRVIDKTSGPVEESRALAVHAKSLELLDKLSLAERAVEGGERVGAAVVLKEGKPVGKLSFFGDGQVDRAPYPFALIYEQHRTERLLTQGLEEAGGRRVEWNTKLLNLSQKPDGATATVLRPDGTEEIIEAGWVVGADGASSPVRHSLGLGFEGDTYEETLFLADVEMEWNFEPRRLYLDLTREDFYAFFPMPGEKRYRLVGNLPEELKGKEAFTRTDLQELLDDHAGVETRVTTVRWTSVYKIHRRITERFRVGRVFLTGDAAHVHSPAGGQGMNTGIGDAYNLAWKLALVAKGEAKPGLLDSYEAERMPFARAILSGSDRAFSLLVTANPLARAPKLFAVSLLFRLVSGVPPLRRRAFWFVSQLWTEYRDSPAVEQCGPAKKGPKAGERAPYGFYESGPESGKIIFESLREPDHHLLIFEGERPDPNRLEATREEVGRMLDRYGVTVHVHQIGTANGSLHALYGAKRSSLVLIRPDGHVAYRGEAADTVGLKMYLDRLFVAHGSRAEENADARGEKRSIKV